MNEHLKRGNLLWEGSRMFLPEHKEALLKQKEEEQKVPKPELDEQAFQEIAIVILDALNHTLPVSIDYWTLGKIKQAEGLVNRVHEREQLIYLETANGPITLNFNSLINVELL
ncbi:YolD-like family protein [Alkalihalobacillus sp. 1P02AB]|uniref:YolD-like family protein n=1 Tax=Alkalihalobacillus sp. 1P02AB TaxID=3132260 RepID=UPI0039A42E61